MNWLQRVLNGLRPKRKVNKLFEAGRTQVTYEDIEYEDVELVDKGPSDVDGIEAHSYELRGRASRRIQTALRNAPRRSRKTRRC